MTILRTTPATIEERFRASVLSPLIPKPGRFVDNATKLKDDLKLDSLDISEMVVGAELEFGVVIEDRDVAKLVTVGDCIALIERLAAKPSASEAA